MIKLFTSEFQNLARGNLFSTGSNVEVIPTIPPVLMVTTTPTEPTAELAWTFAGSVLGTGFAFIVEVDIDGLGYNQIATTTDLFHSDNQAMAAGETYTYRVRASNTHGEGPNSNAVGVVLPGE